MKTKQVGVFGTAENPFCEQDYFSEWNNKSKASMKKAVIENV